MANSPRVSVIVPARNAAPFIEETLHSILGQTFVDLEVLVVDDGSTDGTFEIVDRVARRDTRVRTFSTESRGVSFARNHAIPHCGGELIAALDSDDLWHPEKLERQIAVLGSRPGRFVVTGFQRFSGDPPEREWLFATIPAASGKGINAVAQIAQFRSVQNYSGNTALMWADDLRAVGGWSLLRTGMDWDLWLKLAGRCECVVIPDLLQYYRKHGNSMTANRDPRVGFEGHLQILRDNPSTQLLPPAAMRRAKRNKCIEFAHAFRVRSDWKSLSEALAHGLFAHHGWSDRHYLTEAARQLWRYAGQLMAPERG